MEKLICQSCGKKGDVADFDGKKCDECDGIVVTRKEMEGTVIKWD